MLVYSSSMANKTDEVINYIRQQIASGALVPGGKIPSEYQLASQFGIHKSTANKAVTRLAELGVVTRLRGKAGTVVAPRQVFPAGRIALICAHGRFSFMRKITEGAQFAAYERDYSLEFFGISDPAHVPGIVEKIRASRVDGVLCLTGDIHADTFSVPVVYVNTTPEVCGVSSVNSDNYTGGRLIARHLIERGHRCILEVRKRGYSDQHFIERENGFNAEIASQSSGGVDVRVLSLSCEHTDTVSVIKEARAAEPDISVVAFTTDCEAYFCAIQLLKEGVRIPESISVCGFGALDEYRAPSFFIDTIEQNPFRMGSVAATQLIDQIEGRGEGKATVLPVRMLPGNTVATLAR